ncbi:MAG: CorA family divalent cation transporter [Gammaproteobacteria bacterium]
MTFRNARRLQVRIAAPRVILFEYPNAPGSDKGAEPDGDLLRTGFLLLDLFFPNHNADHSATLDDLLDLNELFRYWRKPYVGHDTAGHKGYGYVDLLAECPVNPLDPRKTISESCTGVEKYLQRWASLLECPIEIAGPHGKESYALFPSDAKNHARTWVEQADGGAPVEDAGWIVYADDRTFVWTCAVLKDGAQSLWDAFGESEQPAEGSPNGRESHSQTWRPHRYGHWIKLLNVDQPSGDPVQTHSKVHEFERRWAKERTYHRWEEGGSYYGFNYHSGAMIGPPWKEPPLWEHFSTFYFDIVLLLFYLRVSLFRFSKDLTEISAQARDEQKTGSKKDAVTREKWRREFQELRRRFAFFTNLYQFPLLSNQQQSLEMYAIARKTMDVDDLFHEIQDQIKSTHEFLAMTEAHETTQIATLLTVVATVGLAFTVVLSFFGMNIIFTHGWKGWKILGVEVAFFVAALVVVSLLFWGVIRNAQRLFLRFSKWARLDKEIEQ